MTLNPESQAREEARRKAAADWLQRLDDPALPEADLQAWLHWHGESEQNRKAFEEMQTLYRQLRDLPGGYRRELRQRFGHTEALPRRAWPKMLALAATVLLAVAGAGGLPFRPGGASAGKFKLSQGLARPAGRLRLIRTLAQVRVGAAVRARVLDHHLAPALPAPHKALQ